MEKQSLLQNRQKKQGPRRVNRAWLLMFALGAAALLFAGCSAGGQPAATADLKPRAIKLEAVAKKTIAAPVEQVADVLSGTTWDVVSKANGEVQSVLKARGQYVEKDEVLFTINSKDAESARIKSELSLRSAEVSLQQAKDNKDSNRQDLVNNVSRSQTSLDNAQKDYNKIRNDFDAGLVKQNQVDAVKQALDEAERNLQSAQSKLTAFDKSDTVTAAQVQAESARVALDDANRALDNYNVKAAGSGILTDFNVVAGQTVSSASGKVGQIQQVDPIKLKTELTEANYQLVKGKQELVYYNPSTPNDKKKAQISYLSPIMSAVSKTYALELAIANPDRTIQPGSRYMVQLTTETEEEVLAIPSLSIVREEANTYVFVLQSGEYKKKQVKLGRINGEYQEVLDGLKNGEQVVVTGQNTLKDGQKAESAPAAPAAAK